MAADKEIADASHDPIPSNFRLAYSQRHLSVGDDPHLERVLEPKHAERLTEATLRALRPGDTVRDPAARGLRARRQRKGIIFELRYKDPVFAKWRSVVVGRWGPGTMALRLEDQAGNPTGQTMRIGDPRHQLLPVIRAKAVEMLASLKAGHDPRIDASPTGLTVQNAFDLHAERMVRRGRSAGTLEDYRYKLDRYLADWKDVLLAKITRPMVRKKHNDISAAHGKYAANSAMRTFRAIWNTARKHDETLGECPTIAVEMHPEQARDTAIKPEDLAAWYARVMGLSNPVTRDFHLFLLFTGLRRTSAATVKWEHVDLEKGTLRIPAPKGGERRAFTMPAVRLSDPTAEGPQGRQRGALSQEHLRVPIGGQQERPYRGTAAHAVCGGPREAAEGPRRRPALTARPPAHLRSGVRASLTLSCDFTRDDMPFPEVRLGMRLVNLDIEDEKGRPIRSVVVDDTHDPALRHFLFPSRKPKLSDDEDREKPGDGKTSKRKDNDGHALAVLRDASAGGLTYSEWLNRTGIKNGTFGDVVRRLAAASGAGSRRNCAASTQCGARSISRG